MVRRMHRRSDRLAFASVLVLGLAACSSHHPGYRPNTYAIASGHYNHPVAIGSGTIAGEAWTLQADVDGNGQLCMGIFCLPATEDAGYGCGFGSNKIDDGGRGTEPTSTSRSVNGAVLAYGPSPVGAATATLSTPAIPGTECLGSTLSPVTVSITNHLPAWYPVSGGWFVTSIPSAALTCVIDVTFRGSDGVLVPELKNF